MKIKGEELTVATKNDKYFFEGTEKLLEIWFDCSGRTDQADLRMIERLVHDLTNIYRHCIIEVWL